MKHIMAILISVFSLGYHGKTIDFEKYSPCHRTTVAHFLNKGKWDDTKLEDILKSTVIQFIYKEAQQSGKPVFCIVDDTISSKTKPSSRALHPIEDAYFHQSHLKGKQDYGHQAVAVMLSCNGIVLNYAIVMYDKSKSKVKIVQEIADERGQSLAQMALAWILRDGKITSVLIGASRPEQVRENSKALDNIRFSQEECDRIDGILS